jgi:hypothetical protein
MVNSLTICRPPRDQTHFHDRRMTGRVLPAAREPKFAEIAPHSIEPARPLGDPSPIALPPVSALAFTFMPVVAGRADRRSAFATFAICAPIPALKAPTISIGERGRGAGHGRVLARMDIAASPSPMPWPRAPCSRDDRASRPCAQLRDWRTPRSAQPAGVRPREDNQFIRPSRPSRLPSPRSGKGARLPFNRWRCPLMHDLAPRSSSCASRPTHRCMFG